MLRQLSADEKVRQEAFYRETQLHDEASALGSARREGIAEGREIERNALAANMRKKGYSEKEILDLLGDTNV